MKKKAAVIACILAASLSLTACGGTKKNDGETTLRLAWWGGEPRHKSTIEVVDMYKAANPGIQIETEYVAWSGYWDKLASQMAAKNLPDIIQQDYAYLGQWIEKNQLADLTEYVNNNTLDLSDVGDNFVGGKIDGKIYGISLGTNALAMMYNPEVYSKAGVKEPDENYTWSQFMSDAEKIKSAGYATDLLLNNDPKFMVEQMAREKGMTFYSEDGTSLGFDAKLVEDALEMQSRLVKKGLSVDKDLAYSVQNIEDSLILAKKTYNSIAWSNNFVPVAKLTHDAGFELSLSVMPRLDGAEKSGVYLKPSMLFSVAASSENKEEAAKFISYFINDLDANKVLAGERGIPVSSKVREAIKDTVPDYEKKVYDYIDLVGKVGSPIDKPEPAGSGEVSSVLKTIFEEIVRETKTPSEGAAEFVKTANEILAKNK